MKKESKRGEEEMTGRTARRVEDRNTLFVACCAALLVIAALSFVPSGDAYANETSAIERRLTSFIKEYYGAEDEIQISFQNLPAYLKGKVRVKTVNFARVPDAQGSGLCAVEFDSKDSKERSVYVAFKVLKKKRLFVLKEAGKKGDIITAADLTEKEVYISGASAYLSSHNDVIGRRLRKNVHGGTVLTSQELEEQVLVRQGDVVNIVAENPRLLIHASGKAVERGRMGETIRVKNLNSGKEVWGRVTGSNTVSVEF